MKNKREPACRQAGFTFIEILVSVTIIAVLIAIGVASYASINRRARDAKRKSDLEQIRSALEQYRADFGSYPVQSGWALSSAGSNWIDDLTPSYMDNVPVDPQNTGTSEPGGVAPEAVYAYRSDATCGFVVGGREFILAAVLESGEEQVTTYGTCIDWSASGWYAIGEK